MTQEVGVDLFIKYIKGEEKIFELLNLLFPNQIEK